MLIDPEICIGCETCLEYCPVEAIKMEGDTAVIDHDLCTECGNCFRGDVCPVDAIHYEFAGKKRVGGTQGEQH